VGRRRLKTVDLEFPDVILSFAKEGGFQRIQSVERLPGIYPSAAFF
jgi:hypothetical protein